MKYLTIGIIILLLGVFMAALFMPKVAYVSPMINKTVPEFKVENIDGGVIDAKYVKDKYTLINFFASWCTSCLAEHQYLSLLKGYKNLQIYGIAWHDDKDSLSKWLKKNGNPYHQVGIDKEGKLVIDFGLTGVPETFLISPQGQIIFHQAGPLDKNIVENNIIKKIESNNAN